MDDWIEKSLMGCLFFCLAALLGIIIVAGVAAYQELGRPTFDLKKDDWSCSENHVESYTTLIMVGKVMVPQTHVSTVCDNYRRIR
jgi:hypothetical protein